MKIHAHIMAWNESKILPFTLDHYSQFCEKIFIYDNMSDDGSDKVYERYDKVSVKKWQNPDSQYNELHQVNIRNTAYKSSRRKDIDWVIVCDCDEFLYHPYLVEKLKEYKDKGINVPKIDGHDMCAVKFPKYDGELLTEKVKIGSETYDIMSKNIIFDPILDVQFGIGSHSFKAPTGKFSEEAEIMLLHYKFLGKDYVNWRYDMLAKRRNEQMKKTRLSEHWTRPPMTYMDKMLEEQYKVI